MCQNMRDWSSRNRLGGRCINSGDMVEMDCRAFQVALGSLPAPAHECGCKRSGLDAWVRKMPWRRAWQPSPVFFPGESHGQRSLADYSPQGHKELDMTEATQHAMVMKKGKLIQRLFIIARTRTQPRCLSADEWIRKLWYLYTMEYYSAVKKNSFESVLMRWMKLEPIIQSEVSQKDKDKYSILMHIYGI